MLCCAVMGIERARHVSRFLRGHYSDDRREREYRAQKPSERTEGVQFPLGFAVP